MDGNGPHGRKASYKEREVVKQIRDHGRGFWNERDDTKWLI